MVNNKEWYEQGQRSYKEGKNIEDNPYKEDTIPYSDWKDGWFDADWEYYKRTTNGTN